jgi:hypothetical protein
MSLPLRMLGWALCLTSLAALVDESLVMQLLSVLAVLLVIMVTAWIIIYGDKIKAAWLLFCNMIREG